MSRRQDVVRESFKSITAILMAQYRMAVWAKSAAPNDRYWAPEESGIGSSGYPYIARGIKPHRLFWVKHRKNNLIRLDWICGQKFTVTGEGQYPEDAMADLVNNLLRLGPENMVKYA